MLLSTNGVQNSDKISRRNETFCVTMTVVVGSYQTSPEELIQVPSTKMRKGSLSLLGDCVDSVKKMFRLWPHD